MNKELIEMMGKMMEQMTEMKEGFDGVDLQLSSIYDPKKPQPIINGPRFFLYTKHA